MAQIDRIIIRFEIQGGTQAQMLLTAMNTTLKALTGSTVAAAKGTQVYSAAVGVGATSTAIFNTSVSSAIFKISEFAVVIFAVVGAYRALMGPIVDVNKNMKIVESVSHATARELRILQDEALRLGTIFPGGAKKATQALVAIGQAGYDTRESIELLQPVFALATIGQVDFDDAVQLVITTLNAFRRDTSEAGKTVDTLASSISHTLTVFETFGTTMPMIAALASDLGVSFEELVALIGWLSDRGIKASRVGTALKAVFAELSKETVTLSKRLQGTGLSTEMFDIKARGLLAVLRDVGEAELTTAQKLDLLGLRGIYALEIFESVDEILVEMVDALEQTGESAFQSSTILEGTTSKWGQLVGTIQQGLVKTFGPLLESLNWIIDRLKMLMRAIGNISPGWRVFWRYTVGVSLALAVLNVLLKGTSILFGFLIANIKGIAANLALSWKGLVLFTSGVKLSTLALAKQTSATIAATVALKAFYATMTRFIIFLGILWLIGEAWTQYTRSEQGALDTTIDHIAELERQQAALKGVLGRMRDVEKKLKDLKKGEGDANVALAEFYDTIFEMIDIYPEFLLHSDTLLDIFSNMPSTIDAAGDAIARMRGQIKLLGDEIVGFQKLKFAMEFGMISDEAMKKVPTQLSTGYVTGSFESRREIIIDWETGFLQKEFEARKREVRILLESAGREFAGIMEDQFMLDLAGIMPRELPRIMDFATGEMEKLKNELSEGKIDADEYKTALEDITAPMEALTRQALINARALAGIDVGEDGEPPPGPPGPGAKYVVPGYDEFIKSVSMARAEAARDEAELATFLQLMRTDELEATRQKLKLSKENLELLHDQYSAYIPILQAHIITLTSAEDRKKAEDALNNILRAQIGIETQLITTEGKRYKNFYDMVGRIIDDLLKKWDEYNDKITSMKESYDGLIESVGTFESIMQDLEQMKILGELFDKDSLDIAQEKLREIESNIEKVIKLQRDLREGTKDWVKALGGYADKLLSFLDMLLPQLIAVREELAANIEELEAEEFAKKLKTDTEESVKDAITSALMSGSVKDAVNIFGDMIKQAVAEKLAGQIADSLFGGFTSGLSMFRGGSPGEDIKKTDAEGNVVTTPGGIGLSAFMAQAMPWIAGGLLIASMFGGGDKINKLETKLDYVLRGAGYQLPASFVLPEDEGEFAFRRRGRDSFAIRFPKRSLDINIKHVFEWRPGELARAIATDMSVGGMGGVKQYSLIGGE